MPVGDICRVLDSSRLLPICKAPNVVNLAHNINVRLGLYFKEEAVRLHLDCIAFNATNIDTEQFGITISY